ncbi:MAG: HlyD family secretion protein, partial [Acidobacteriota bacterium]
MGKGVFSKRNLIIIGVVTLIAAVVGLNIYRSGQKDVVSVKTTVVKQRKLVEKVPASGKVFTSQKEVIYSQVTGTVKKVNVKLGDSVKPGQVLMELDIPDAQQRLYQAKSSLAVAESALIKAKATGKSLDLIEAESAFRLAESNYRLAKDGLDRTRLLYKEGAVSRAEMDSTQADFNYKQDQYDKARASLKAARASADISLQAIEASYEGAKASLALVQRQTAQSGISAAIAGKVMSIGVENGDLVNMNTSLITVGNVDDLQVKADVTEADAAKIAMGQKVEITAGALPDEIYHGTVSEIGMEAVSKVKNQSETTGVPVVIAINDKTLLRPGYNVDLEVTTVTVKKALVVPFDAVVDRKGKPHVFVIEKGV